MAWHDHRGHVPDKEASVLKTDNAENSAGFTDCVTMDEEFIQKYIQPAIDLAMLIKKPVNHTRRYTIAGTYVDNGVKEEHLKEHVHHNVLYRFGQALFVNGVCVYRRYLSHEKCTEIVSELARLQVTVSPSHLPYA